MHRGAAFHCGDICVLRPSLMKGKMMCPLKRNPPVVNAGHGQGADLFIE